MHQGRPGQGDAGDARRRVHDRPGQDGEAVLRGGEGDQRPHVGALVAECGTEPVGTGCGPQVGQRHAGVRRVQPPRIRQVLQPQRRAAGQRVPAGQDDRQFPLGHHDGAAAPASSRSGSPGAATPSTRPRSTVPAATAGGTASRPMTCSVTASRGCDWRMPASADATNPVIASGASPNTSWAGGGAAIRVTSARAASSRRRIGPACSSRRAPASVTVTGRQAQQRRAQIGFQRGDLLRDRRLGVAEVAGRERERAEVGHGHERAQEVRIHRA